LSGMSPGGLTSVAAGCGGLGDVVFAGALDVDGAEPDVPAAAVGVPDELPLHPARTAVAAASRMIAGTAVRLLTSVLTEIPPALVPAVLRRRLQR
jgi:hypothetical protein